MNRKFAKLCLDCDEIYESKIQVCPECASQRPWLLGNWLGAIDSASIYVNKPFIERKNDGKNCDDGDPPWISHLAGSYSI